MYCTSKREMESSPEEYHRRESTYDKSSPNVSEEEEAYLLPFSGHMLLERGGGRRRG